MTQKEMFDNLCSTFDKMCSVLQSKGNDYSSETDALSNFKQAGAICRISAEQHCLALIATKVARLGVLLKGKTPKNESVEDSIIDLINYSFLLKCLNDEKHLSDKEGN